MALPKLGAVTVPQTQVNGRQHVNASAPAFIRCTSSIRRRLITNIQGPEKSGKDHMAFSYSGGPIYVHSFDIGLEGVVEKFLEGGEFCTGNEIYKVEYELEVQPGDDVDTKDVGHSANRLLSQFISNYNDTLASTRTEGLVLVDTGTEAWELVRLAYFGKLSQVPPHLYAKPNAEFRKLVRDGFDATNVVWLHKEKDVYEEYTDAKGQTQRKKTGNKSAKMMNDIPFLVQINVQTQRIVSPENEVTFQARIIDSRHHPYLIGRELPNNFDMLLTEVHGE